MNKNIICKKIQKKINKIKKNINFVSETEFKEIQKYIDGLNAYYIYYAMFGSDAEC